MSQRVTGHRFLIRATLNNKFIGVAIVGPPVSRELDYTTTLEVLSKVASV